MYDHNMKITSYNVMKKMTYIKFNGTFLKPKTPVGISIPFFEMLVLKKTIKNFKHCYNRPYIWGGGGERHNPWVIISSLIVFWFGVWFSAPGGDLLMIWKKKI
jgi:hypothetical protein